MREEKPKEKKYIFYCPRHRIEFEASGWEWHESPNVQLADCQHNCGYRANIRKDEVSTKS